MSLYIHDDLLGYALNPGWRGGGVDDSVHTICDDGLRFSGGVPASGEGAILAVGDSFTYGDEVSDEESWPAQLQRLTGQRVLNGGVTGYGLDQIVLRAEQLTARYKPSIIIASFIGDDIRRTEMRRIWWRDKPWFAIEGNELVLKGVPVPERKTRMPMHIRNRVDEALIRWPVSFQHLVGYHLRAHRSGQGVLIARRLMERLAALKRSARVIVMAQYEIGDWFGRTEDKGRRRIAVQSVLESASACGLATLDTFQRMASEPQRQELYGRVHLNARGNRIIASLLAAALPALVSNRE